MIEFMTTEKFKSDIFNYETEEQWAYEKDQPLIINFTASWCGPCRMFAPILDEVSEAYEGKLQVLKIDIDAEPILPALFGVRSVPTTLFIAKGKEPAIANGAIPIESMKKAIEELLEIKL